MTLSRPSLDVTLLRFVRAARRACAPRARLGALALLFAGLSGCGDASDPALKAVPSADSEIVSNAKVIADHPIPRAGMRGPWFAQEMWLTYHSPEHEAFGYRYPRTRDDAVTLAKGLFQRVHRGEDLGRLARVHSNGFGGRAFGFAVLAGLRAKPDARDHALVGTPVGGITPLLDWKGGIWFAKRIDRRAGVALQQRFEQEMTRRARARVIVFHHKDAHPSRTETKGITREMATSYALGVLEELEKGAPFEKLAKRYAHDEDTRSRGGLLHSFSPRAGEDPSWLHWGESGYPAKLLDVILETGAVGRVHPQPVDTARGVMVVEVLEREGGVPGEARR